MIDHPSFQSRLSAQARSSLTREPADIRGLARRCAGRSCCCSARPAVIAIMPSTSDRGWTMDLLLCGHHYRQSRAALLAHGATLLDATGEPVGANLWPNPAL